MKSFLFSVLLAVMTLAAACSHPKPQDPLPRGAASPALDEAFTSYLQAVADSSEELHSIMVLQHGKVRGTHTVNCRQ